MYKNVTYIKYVEMPYINEYLAYIGLDKLAAPDDFFSSMLQHQICCGAAILPILVRILSKWEGD